jgi:putative phage-type endonuclease
MSLTTEQIEKRLDYITGSDAAVICGASPWGNVVDLWKQKRRIIQPQDISSRPVVRAGNYLEPVVRQWFEDDSNKKVQLDGDLIIHKTIPYMAANIDGRVVEDRAVFEAKTASRDTGWGAIGENVIPDYYLCQVAHYMAVEDAHRAFVAVLIRGSDFRYYTIERDLRFEEMILKKEKEFWEMVKTGVPPKPRTSDELISLHGYATIEDSVESNDEINDALEHIKEIKNYISMAQEKQKELEETVKVYMGKSPVLTSKENKVLATWRTAKSSKRFDANRFKEEQEMLYNEYLTDGTEQRRFLIK